MQTKIINLVFLTRTMSLLSDPAFLTSSVIKTSGPGDRFIKTK